MNLLDSVVGIEKYSIQDKLRLIEALWESIPDDLGMIEVPQEHIDELDRRLAAMEADPLAGSSWEEVKPRLRGNH